MPALEQREPFEALLDLLGITAPTWCTILHYHKSCKSLLPKQFQAIAYKLGAFRFCATTQLHSYLT